MARPVRSVQPDLFVVRLVAGKTPSDADLNACPSFGSSTSTRGSLSWRPADSCPEVLTDTLAWQPFAEYPSLATDLNAYFADVWEDEPGGSA